MKKSFIVLVVLILAVSGCATFNRLVTNNELTMQLATEAATARVIHDHPAWKHQVISITRDAMMMIDSSKLVELVDVEEFVKSRITWRNLLPEEHAMISVLIAKVRSNIEDTFLARDIADPGAQMIEVKKVLGWINASAQRQWEGM